MAGEQKFTRLGVTRLDLDVAWRDRLKDAEESFAAGRFAATIAAGLYALEICLKVRICQRLDLESLPRAFEVHELDGLLLLSGLSRRLLDSRRWRTSRVRTNWDSIRNWSNQLNDLRYLPDHNWGRSQAETLLRQLKDPREGVLPWLSKQR